MRIIADRPPKQMMRLDFDCQCARCGSSVEYRHCDQCEDGFDGHECGEDVCACYMPEDNCVCQICNGEGGWRVCMSSPEWCEANPLPDRAGVKRGEIEWFTCDDGEIVR